MAKSRPRGHSGLLVSHCPRKQSRRFPYRHAHASADRFQSIQSAVPPLAPFRRRLDGVRISRSSREVLSAGCGFRSREQAIEGDRFRCAAAGLEGQLPRTTRRRKLRSGNLRKLTGSFVGLRNTTNTVPKGQGAAAGSVKEAGEVWAVKSPETAVHARLGNALRCLPQAEPRPSRSGPVKHFFGILLLAFTLGVSK
jgi:hypothetical protein